MSHTPISRRTLPFTLVLLGFTCLASLPAQAFNPNDELQATAASGTRGLPTTASVPPVAPQVVVQMPAQPLYPTRAGAVSAPLAAPMLPPVDPAVAAQAQAVMQAEQQNMAAAQNGFIAPAPVLAVAPQDIGSPLPAAAPIMPVTPMPMAAAPMMPTAPELSDETRTILSGVPAKLDAPKAGAAGSLTMDRVSPEIKEILGAKAQEESFEAVGLSIKVSRPGLDTNYELTRAYTALMGGDTQTAIQTYKNILSTEPQNEDALFGLAATYHRQGLIDKARPIYGMLLKVNPNHREGLNNFLVLVSEESPQDALPELERLEARNPDFSPIPAQTAIVLDKLGYVEASRERMIRAIELAPDNMSYKYNLAVMLDKQGQYADATALYRNLIEASLQGANVPASLETMQKRLNYLTTQRNIARTAAVNSAATN